MWLYSDCITYQTIQYKDGTRLHEALQGPYTQLGVFLQEHKFIK